MRNLNAILTCESKKLNGKRTEKCWKEVTHEEIVQKKRVHKGSPS